MHIIEREQSQFHKNWEQLELRSSFKFNHKYSSNIIKYNKEYGNYSFVKDVSFIVINDDGNQVCGLKAYINKPDNKSPELSIYGIPILFLINNELQDHHLRKIKKLLLKKIKSILESEKDLRVVYVDYLINNLSICSEVLLNLGFCIKPIFTTIIDTSVKTEILKSSLTSSNKAYVNWGLENMRIEIINQNNLDPSHFKNFQDLHMQASGRATRTQKTWDIQQLMVKDNQAFAIFGYYDDKLVASALFQHSDNYCYYAVGAYDRNKFDKPISHAIIWQAIDYAKKLNISDFEIGAQFPILSEHDKLSEKEINIAKFKKQFGGKLTMFLELSN